MRAIAKHMVEDVFPICLRAAFLTESVSSWLGCDVFRLLVRKGTTGTLAGGNLVSYDILASFDSSLEYFLACHCSAGKPHTDERGQCTHDGPAVHIFNLLL